jgi:hypothetical protein
MPLDSEPNQHGNILLEDGDPPTGHVLAGDQLADARANAEVLYLSHFVTCPYAQSFRR